MNAYTPTEHDRTVGARLRDLRKRRGETIPQMIEGSGLNLKQSSVSRIELGERRLTEIEAAPLAAHFGIAVSQLLGPAKRPALEPVARTEQAWLGNEDPKPALFAVPDLLGAAAVEVGGTITIDLKKPLTPEQYRAQVWVPYLEARYAADQQKTA